MKITVKKESIISHKSINLSDVKGLSGKAEEFLKGTNDDQPFITDYLVNNDVFCQRIWTEDLKNFLENSDDEIEENLKAELTKLNKILSDAAVDYILNNE